MHHNRPQAKDFGAIRLVQFRMARAQSTVKTSQLAESRMDMTSIHQFLSTTATELAIKVMAAIAF